MTGILDRIRNTTVADLEKVTGSFDDVPTPVYRPRVEREMIRVVKGATDLKDAMPVRVPSVNAGMSDYDNPKYDTRPFKDDLRSEGQTRYMNNLIDWITEKDPAIGDAARTWTDNVTTAGKWSYDKSNKFSISNWIDSLKAKNAELNAAPKPPTDNLRSTDRFADVPDGYYAVQNSGPGDWKFYRFRTNGPDSKHPGTRNLRLQAGDEFHPIRNASLRSGVLNAIRSMTPAASMALYGQHIGRCGRCGRTLTDPESRACGIGPDCRKKM